MRIRSEVDERRKLWECRERSGVFENNMWWGREPSTTVLGFVTCVYASPMSKGGKAIGYFLR